MRKAPPPFWAAWAGKRRKLPRPTALPAMASTSPTLDPQPSRAAMSRGSPPWMRSGQDRRGQDTEPPANVNDRAYLKVLQHLVGVFGGVDLRVEIGRASW